MSIGVLVIGLGQIGMASDLNLAHDKFVYTHARAFEQHPSFTLLGGVDACHDRCAEFSSRYHRPAFSNVSEGMVVCRPAVVVIAVPTEAHADVLQEVLRVGAPRAVLCEKPLSYDYFVAQRMVESCQKFNCQLFVNYVRRADPAVLEIKSRLEVGQINTPAKGVVWYSKGLFHNGSHFFDLMQYWLGAMQSFSLLQIGRRWGDDPEPDVAIVFGSSLVYFIAAYEENYSHYTAELVFPSGRLRYDLGGERVIWQPAVVSEQLQDYKVLDSNEHQLANALDRIQWHVANQLAAALTGSPASLCNGQEALSTIKCLTSIKNAL